MIAFLVGLEREGSGWRTAVRDRSRGNVTSQSLVFPDGGAGRAPLRLTAAASTMPAGPQAVRSPSVARSAHCDPCTESVKVASGTSGGHKRIMYVKDDMYEVSGMLAGPMSELESSRAQAAQGPHPSRVLSTTRRCNQVWVKE